MIWTESGEMVKRLPEKIFNAKMQTFYLLKKEHFSLEVFFFVKTSDGTNR